MQHPYRSPRLLFLLPIVVALTACNGDSANDPLEAARALKSKGDAAGAYAAVKAALQESPNSGQARTLLAQLLLEQADPASAELEFRKALEANHEPAKTTALLARSLVAQGKYARVVDEFGGLPSSGAKSSDDLTIQVAIAHAYLRDFAAARRLVDTVLARQPDLPDARLLDAKLVAVKGETDIAVEKVKPLTTSNSPLPEALLFLGDLLLDGRRDTAGALAAYQRVVELAPKTLRAHAALITDALSHSDTKRATAQLEKLRGALPQHPLTKLYEAQIAFTAGKFDRASEICQEILRRTSGNYSVYLLAGASSLQRGAIAQAISDLGKAMSLRPDASLPRQLLAQAQLRLGVPTKAIEILRPVLESGSNEPELLSTAAEAHLSVGAFAAAELLYQRAAKSKPNDPKIATSLALLKFSKGQDLAAIDSLELIAKSDPGISANLALISAFIKKRDLASAMKAVEALAVKTPQSPVADNLRGQIFLKSRNTSGAREAFESALRKDPAHFAATASLAQLDIRDGRIDSARKRMEDLVARRPGASAATLLLAQQRLNSGEKHSAIQPLLDAAVRANPIDPGLRVAQVDNALAANDTKSAVNFAQQASAALPNSPDVTEALGRAQLSSGEINQSLATFGKLTQLMPNSASGRIMAARVHIANKNSAAAAAALRQALEVEPGSIEAQRLLLTLAKSAKNPDLARDIAKAMQKRSPDEAVGYLFAGDIEAELKEYKSAAIAYRGGLGKIRQKNLPNRLHLMLQLSGQKNEADNFAKDWTKSHPKDTAFAFYLGDAEFTRVNYPAALAAYERVLKIDPNHAMALNNSGYLRTLLKMPGGLAMAERANELAPDMPPILDTLAFALAQLGKVDEAIPLSRRAVELAPKDPKYVVSLARNLALGGQREDALAMLSKVEQQYPSLAKDSAVLTIKRTLGK